MDTRP